MGFVKAHFFFKTSLPTSDGFGRPACMCLILQKTSLRGNQPLRPLKPPGLDPGRLGPPRGLGPPGL